MEKIINSVKGIMNSITISGERIRQNTLSQKDRQAMSMAIGEVIEDINKKELQNNGRVQQLKEQLANLQDAFFSQESGQILQLQENISERLKPLEYEMNFNRLTADIFQTDSQIMTLQDEKNAAIQELIDLDMQVHGQLTDITKQVLEVNHVSIGEDNSEEKKTGIENLDEENYKYFYSGQDDEKAEQFQKEKGWNKIWASDTQGMNGDTWIVYRSVSDLPVFLQDYARQQEKNEDKKEFSAKNKEVQPVPEEKYVGTAYVTDIAKTDRKSFRGKSPEAIIETVREQQKQPDSPLANVKSIYIQKEGKTNSYLKYDIASGKDITPTYLQLPYMGKEEFKKTVAYLKENGAMYNAHKKAWYVTPQQDFNKFKEYLPEKAVASAEKEKTKPKANTAEELINQLEKERMIFSGDERNLIVNYAYHIKDMEKVSNLADRIIASHGGKENYFTIADWVEKEIENKAASEVEKPQKATLYGVQVPVDYSINSKGLKIIKQKGFDRIIKQYFKEMQDSNESKTLELSKCLFDGIDFTAEKFGKLTNVNFNGSYFFHNCIFDRTQFEHVNFTEASLYDCKFKRAEFINCDFSQSTMSHCREENSIFSGCDFEAARLKQGYFKQTVMQNINLDGAVIDGTSFRDVIAKDISLVNTSFTMGGATSQEVADYAKRTKEALLDYEKSISADNSKNTVSNSLMDKLNENKTKAEEYNKQNKPLEERRETEVVK